MAETQARYPQCPVTDFQAEEWLKDWNQLLREFGQERFEWALNQARLNCKFFPQPADIREYALEFKFPPLAIDHGCRNCGGSGWRPVSGSAGPNKLPTVVRCECRGQE